MAETQKDFLLALIKSLTKSEKRQFKLYVNRLGINADAKFLLLFNEMDQMGEYDEKKILNKKITTKQQLSNLKAHLYRQILISLRTNPSNQINRIQLREQLDFATLLYNKGLYKQSLKILEKVKQQALEHEEKYIAYEIVEMEKVIESQFITRSIKSRADDLIADAKYISKLNALNSKLSNLSLKLYSMMLSNGYAKNDENKEHIIKFFNENLPKKDMELMEFREKLWFYKAHVWKNLLVQNYIYTYNYAFKWVDLFYQFPEMIQNHPVWFVKGNSYLLNALFYLRKKDKFDGLLQKFEDTLNSEIFPKNDNTEAVAFTVLYNAKINSIFMNGSYDKAEKLIKETLAHKEFHDEKIDDHHILVLNFKMASVYFAIENYQQSITVLDRIIGHKNTSVREELYFYARILSIMVMMDSGIDKYLEEYLDETAKFLKKMKQANTVHTSILELFIELNNAFPNEKKEIYEKYLEKFNSQSKGNYNSRNFVYIDIISWLEAKVLGKKIADIFKEKSY